MANGGGVGKSVEQGVTSRKWKFGCLHGNSEHQGMLQRLVNAKPDHGLQSKPASVHVSYWPNSYRVLLHCASCGNTF